MAAPIITSNGGGANATVNVVSGTTAVARVQASGGTLVYSISGGDDQALFTINSSTGALAFASAPNYSIPASSVLTNDYVVNVTATDAGGSDSQSLTATVIRNSPNDHILEVGTGIST